MEHTLQSQLSMLPVPRLTTVLRVNVDLLSGEGAFQRSAALILDWWNRKGESYGIHIGENDNDVSFTQNRFKVEFARSADLFALAMEEPDSQPDLERDWICDFGLRQMEGKLQLEVRVSFRQPHNALGRPDPRAPTLLRELLVRVGATDSQKMTLTARTIDKEQVGSLSELLLSPTRRLPVVVISEETGTGPLVIPDSLSKVLAGAAHTFRITQDASWQISRDWGHEWSVFQGAIRCYNPQMQWDDDKFRHRLWLARDVRRANAGSRNGFLNVCGIHVFTQVTAQFETLPFLSPAAIRRLTTAAKVMVDFPTLELQLTPPEHRQKPKQMSLDVGTGTERNSAAESPSDNKLAPELSVENSDLRKALAALEISLQKQEEAARTRERRATDLEAQLDQERAGRADDAKVHQETKDTLWLYEQENKELKERDELLRGGGSESSDALRPLWLNMSQLFQTAQQIATQFRRLEKDSTALEEGFEQMESLNRTNASLQAKLDSISIRPNVSVHASQEEETVLRASVIKVIPQLLRKPTLFDTLECFALIYPDRLTVLDSAYDSALDSSEFRNVTKAFDLLMKLANEYWDAMMDGQGDVSARSAFSTGVFAAKESEAISKSGTRRRTFLYGDRSIFMEKHLKVGTADNAADTLRIHFEWVADEGRVVIGHCGKHLDF